MKTLIYGLLIWSLVLLPSAIKATEITSAIVTSMTDTSKTDTSADKPELTSTPELSTQQLAAIFNQQATPAQLTQLAAQLQLRPQAKGLFSQTRYLAVLKKPLESAGSFMFSQQVGLFWQQTTPFPTTLVLKDRLLIQQDSMGNIQQSQANQASSAMAEQLPLLMQALLMGDVKALEKDFQLYMSAPSVADEWQLGLVAKDPLIQKAIGGLILEGGKTSTTAASQIKRLTMVTSIADAAAHQNTDKTIISFTAIENQLSDDDIQRFNLAPAGSDAY
ncbi:outer membrane lipoprotein carrier protein LolA [Pseudomonadota bacterium]